MKKLLVLLVTLFGCDSSAVLANIDTYTCSYLPGVVDCTTPEVHNKAVSILENGVVEANMSCYLDVPYAKAEYIGTQPFYTVLTAVYNVTAFHDGAVLSTCQVGGPINLYEPRVAGNLQHYSASRFSARSDDASPYRTCDIQLNTLEVGPFMFQVQDGVVDVQKGDLYAGGGTGTNYYSVEEFCYGFNLEYFE